MPIAMSLMPLLTFGLIISNVIAIPHLRTTSDQEAIAWTSCPKINATNIACANFTVPMDYTKPSGKTITLELRRIRSVSQFQNDDLPSIFYNPGGPGGDANAQLEYCSTNTTMCFSDRLMENYQIVSFNPRGVGENTRVKCDPEKWNNRPNILPTSQEEFDDLIAANKALSESCRNLTGEVFDHVDTLHVIEDLELFRQVLTTDNSPLNLLGLSYGTQIGLQYAERYPQHVGRFVLDGMVDHTLSETSALVGEAATFENSLNNFFKWCDSDTTCELHNQSIGVIFDNLVKSALNSSLSPGTCQDCFYVAAVDIISGTQPALVRQTSFPNLANGIARAYRGDLSFFSVEKATTTNINDYPGLAIGCQDWVHDVETFADLRRKMTMAKTLNPHTLGITQTYLYQTRCLGWTSPVTNPQRTLLPAIQSAPPMFLANSIYDPETSISWANGIRDVLPKSILAVRRGAGHTSYELFGEMSRAMDEFFLTGKLPVDSWEVDT